MDSVSWGDTAAPFGAFGIGATHMNMDGAYTSSIPRIDRVPSLGGAFAAPGSATIAPSRAAQTRNATEDPEHPVKRNVLAIAITGSVALLLSACGGTSTEAPSAQAPAPAPVASSPEPMPSSPEPAPPTPPALQLSGVAATGFAIAGGTIDVKCATGIGTTTTGTDGAYTLRIEDAVLPCVIRASGQSEGVPVVLHSVTEAGSVSGTTSVVANVSPLTEMIVAQIAATAPASVFEAIGGGSAPALSREAIAAARSQVVDALKAATGIDLGAIDPFTSPLRAATPAAPEAGNGHDRLLDALRERVPLAALPMVVNQIASAAGAAATAPADTPLPLTLSEVMGGVAGGSLANCPVAISGRYRFLETYGRTYALNLDFRAGKGTFANTPTATLDITPDPVEACRFRVAGTGVPSGNAIEFDVVIGPGGAGGFRIRNLTLGGQTIGFVFPVQAHPVTALQTRWAFVQSGAYPGVGFEFTGGRMTVDSELRVRACDFIADPATGRYTCGEDDDWSTIEPRPDGGFGLSEANDPTRIYLYRSPAGQTTLFATLNPTGASGPGLEQATIIAWRPFLLAQPPVGSTSRYWDLSRSRGPSASSDTVSGPTADATTVTTSDAATATITRTRDSDGRVDTQVLNVPVEGMRLRPPAPSLAPLVIAPLPGLGLVVANSPGPFQQMPSITAISVARP